MAFGYILLAKVVSTCYMKAVGRPQKWTKICRSTVNVLCVGFCPVDWKILQNISEQCRGQIDASQAVVCRGALVVSATSSK